MQTEIAAFGQLPGVTGVCFIRGARLQANRFPATYGTAAMQEFSTDVGRLFDAYRKSERQPTQIYLEYEDGRLLLISEPPPTPEGNSTVDRQASHPRLAFLLNASAPLNAIIPSARVFLKQQARIEIELCQQFQEQMHLLLGKVMNRAQCTKLFLRVLAQEGLAEVTDLTRDRFLPLGQAMIREIPNRARHAPLLNELESMISNLLRQ